MSKKDDSFVPPLCGNCMHFIPSNLTKHGIRIGLCVSAMTAKQLAMPEQFAVATTEDNTCIGFVAQQKGQP
jgi:hypothetical protein